MPVDEQTVSCKKCKTVLEENTSIIPEERPPCPKCGSKSRTFHVSIHDTISIKNKLGLKGRRADGGKPFIEQISGDDLHRKSGKWMKLERVIDRKNNMYHEIVTDPSTGEIIHECNEPLSEHKGHGSAKYKKC